MKKHLIFILCLITAGTVWAETFPAVVEGMEVTVMDITLKKKYSDPMGNSSPDVTIDLTEGISNSIGALNIEEADQNAYELSFDFSNIEVPLKAWAYNTSDSKYYYTTSSGVGSSTSPNPAVWTGYDYLSVPAILPNRDDGRVVVQSYFPEPLFIGAGDALTVTGLVDLDYCAAYWDGDATGDPGRIGPFRDYPELYPAGTPAFALVVPDVVLAIDETLTPETYIFAADAAALDAGDFNNYRVMTLFFTDGGALYDGAGKSLPGYSVGGSFWARAKGVARNGDDSYNLTIARNYSDQEGGYIFDVTTDNSFTRMNIGDPAGSFTVTADPSGGTGTIHYKRVD